MRKFLTFIYIICLIGIITIGGLLFLTVFPFPGLNMDARVVQSGSMEPAIPTGSVIFIKSSDSYKEGDIITFHRRGRETPTTHRIVEVHDDDNDGSIFLTKGDANPIKDIEPVTEDSILGLVSFHIPFLGYVINFAREPIGLFLLVIVPAAIIATDEIRKIVQEIKKRSTTNVIKEVKKEPVERVRVESKPTSNEVKKKSLDIVTGKKKGDDKKDKKRIYL